MNVLYKPGDKDTRPWGTWEVVATSSDTALKRIMVLPGQRLSDQRHEGRTETWMVIQGEGTVTLDNGTERSEVVVPTGTGIKIPVGHWHRMHNKGNTPLVFMEIQQIDGPNGRLDEADIERRNDDYGRASAASPPATPTAASEPFEDVLPLTAKHDVDAARDICPHGQDAREEVLDLHRT